MKEEFTVRNETGEPCVTWTEADERAFRLRASTYRLGQAFRQLGDACKIATEAFKTGWRGGRGG